MTSESLIGKIKAQKLHPHNSSNSAFNSGLMRTIEIIRQHEKDTNSPVSIHSTEQCKQTDTLNLKPCPFCGSIDLSYEDDNPQNHIDCNKCGMHWSNAGDLEKWNKRVQSSEIPLKHICPHCSPDSGGCGGNHIPDARPSEISVGLGELLKSAFFEGYRARPSIELNPVQAWDESSTKKIISPLLQKRESINSKVIEFLKVIKSGNRKDMKDLGISYDVSEYEELPMACGIAGKILNLIEDGQS